MTQQRNGKVARKCEEAIAALLNYATIDQAAKSIGVHERTLRRWQKRPEYQAAFRAARLQLYELASSRVLYLSTAALLALHRNLTSGNPAVEVRAAQIIFQHCRDEIVVDDMRQRIELLEQEFEAKPVVAPSNSVRALAPPLGTSVAVARPAGENESGVS
jgi:hypothetical protein